MIPRRITRFRLPVTLLSLIVAAADYAKPMSYATDELTGVLTIKWDGCPGPDSCIVKLDPASVTLIKEIQYNGTVVASNITPRYQVIEGTRTLWNPRELWGTFFDNPNDKPPPDAPTVDTKTITLPTTPLITNLGNRLMVSLSNMRVGSFVGTLVFTFYNNSSLFQMEAVMAPLSTKAYIYNATLASSSFTAFRWMNTSGTYSNALSSNLTGIYVPKAVRHRTMMAQTSGGMVGIFPPPHAYFYPRNNTQNQSTTMIGLNKMGIRQSTTGGGVYAPWFDAPSGAMQRMGMFIYMHNSTSPSGVLGQIKKYTHNDTFKAMNEPGNVKKTFMSHSHQNVVKPYDYSNRTLSYWTSNPGPISQLKSVIKGMGVNIFQMAEFHVDDLEVDDSSGKRLADLHSYFEACKTYSDSNFLMIPSEEGKYVSYSPYFCGSPCTPASGNNYSHWMQLLPMPVYFTWGDPTNAHAPVETHPTYGPVYYISNQTELLNMHLAKGALTWTAHPRVKGSVSRPDSYNTQPWYRDPNWIGAVWKALPGDLSKRLGERAFITLDDMRKWGDQKYLHGEVDLFVNGTGEYQGVPIVDNHMDSTHEVYGHMNVNYLGISSVPSFPAGPPYTTGGWQSVLNALKTGNYFTTTGEILIHSWQVANCSSTCQVTADIEWTFPLASARIAGIDTTPNPRVVLAPVVDTAQFEQTTQFDRQRFYFSIPAGAEQVRLEVWDVAGNVAYTQYVNVQ